MINFNVPPYAGTELNYIRDAVEEHKICGDGKYTKKCNIWMEEKFHTKKVLLIREVLWHWILDPAL